MQREHHQRNMIVGLTHTEIMLIFAVVVILLLLVQHSRTAEAERENIGIKEKLVEMREQNETIEELDARLAAEDMGKEVLDILVLNGEISRGGKSLRELKAEVADSVSELIREKKQTSDFMREVDDVLSVKGSVSGEGSDAKNADRLEKIKQNIAAIEQIGKAITDEGAKAEMSATEIAGRVDEIIASSNAAEEKGETLTKAERIKKEIGFVPCWYNEAGSPLYFRTYNITYEEESKRYKIEPHKHWNKGHLTVRLAVDAGLPALKNYPRGWVSADQLQKFGAQLNKQKVNLYGEECRLVATINKDTNGVIVNDIIRDKAYFYPVWRERGD